MNQTVEIHDAANLFPMEEETLAELAESIKANGQRVPVELLDGKVIDGRRRLRACELAGVAPKYKDVSVPDPVAYVIDLNLHRRQLTPGQRAMVGARARELYDRQAKERMSDGGKTAGKGRPKQGVANLPPPIDGLKARDAVGKAVGVSGKSIDHDALRLAREYDPAAWYEGGNVCFRGGVNR